MLRRIEGKSLHDTLALAKDLDARLALVPALVRACQAVAFAHEHGVVHRDLKPQNIMLGRFGETYVLDWGLALVESRAGAPDVTAPHEVGGVVGTPAYMSPELALGLGADARSDVWGLGACLYHLLTGQAPISGRSVQSAMGHASAGEVAPVLALEALAPPDLAAICQKALAQERSHRYADATALAADLEAWLAGRTVSARTYSRGQLLRRALSANGRAVVVVVAGLVLLGGVLGFDELRVRRERNEARLFVRELLRELPQQIDASRQNVQLINALTRRGQQWLGREDLSVEEMEDACDVLAYLAASNAEVSDWAAARALYAASAEMSERGLGLQPDSSAFFGCQVESRAGLAYCEDEAGNTARAGALYAEAWRQMESWKGALSPALRQVRGDVASKWGTSVWTRDPVLGRKLFLEAIDTLSPLLTSPVDRERHSALRRGPNGVTALWSEARLPDAVQLARRFVEAAEPDCADPSLASQRICGMATSSYASVASWVNAPDADRFAQRAIEIEAMVFERDVDSVVEAYDSLGMFMEQGRYTQAAARARLLRLGASASWGVELGPLAAVLAGDLAEVAAWEPLMEEAQTGGRLALGLREAAQGHFPEAARHLRAVKGGRIWYEIFWAAHPRPALELPPAARPAFERFLVDFTRAYGAADMKGLDEAIAALATALEALG